MPKYYPHLYGEKEGGGTQVLVLTGVPYENLDLPKLDDLSTGARSENIQHTLYKGMMLPLAVLAGLTVLVRRNTKTTITTEETIMSHDPQPLGGKIISKPVMIFWTVNRHLYAPDCEASGVRSGLCL